MNLLTLPLENSLTRHPLLTAQVKKRGRRLGWTWDNAAQNNISWIDPPAGGLPRSRRFDLFSESGLQIDGIERAGDTELFIHFHHACSDGKGIERFVNDFLLYYAKLRTSEPDRISLPTTDQSRLYKRGRHHWAALRSVKKWPRQAVGLLGALQFVSRRPSCAVSPGLSANDGDLSKRYPCWLTHRLDSRSLQRMRHAAQNLGVSLNDLMARDVFASVSQWRQLLTDVSDEQWLRMMVPVNLRQREDRKLPAANMVSSVFLDRRHRDCQDASQLLRSIQDEMELIKNLELGLTFPQTLALSSLVPGGLRRTANRGNRISVIFSNVGVVLKSPFLPKVDGCNQYGDVVLREVFAAVPITSFTNIAFFAHQYAKQLWITLHYDSNVINQENANALIELLGKCLEQTMLAGDHQR